MVDMSAEPIVLVDDFDIRYTECHKPSSMPKFQRKSFLNTISQWQKRINAILVYWFENLGALIARRWPFFVFIPLVISGIAITGIQRIRFEKDFESLALPIKGRWSYEFESVKRIFGNKSKNYFEPTRIVSLGQYVNIIIKPKNITKNIYEEDVWYKIVDLDRAIMKEKVIFEGNTFEYDDICSPWKGACVSPLLPIPPDRVSQIVSFLTTIPEYLNNATNSTNDFLIDLLPSNANQLSKFYLQLILGNPEFGKDYVLNSAEAISVFYWIKGDTDFDKERARLWEERVYHLAVGNSDPNLNISFFAARTPTDEMDVASDRMKPLLGLSGCLMVGFAAISAIMRDAVRSKLLMSLIGIVSVVLATGAAFGILMYSGVHFIGVNYATVFLMLGIGIDDMFVFLAAWRMTPLQSSVQERMRAMYGHASVSVTITSLTNITAFSVGILTSIKTIQIFSIYSCLSALLTYIYFMTFFGGCMAAFGHLEASQRHSILFVKVKAKSDSSDRSSFYRYFMTGGISAKDPLNPKDNQPHSGMVIVRDVLGRFLSSSKCKVFICFSYALYVCLIAYGISFLEQETHPDRVSFQKNTIQYFYDFDKYYSNKPSFAQILFTKELKYSDPATRKKLLALHSSLESLPFVKANYTISWIRDWYKNIDNDGPIPTNDNDFVKYLIKTKQTSQGYSFLDCLETLHSLQNLTIEEVFSNKEDMFSFLQNMRNFPCTGKNLMKMLPPNELINKNKDFVRLLDMLFWVSHHINKLLSIYDMDINLNKASKGIASSRILVVIENASDSNVQNLLRGTVEKSGIPGAQVFNYQAFIIEQVGLVRWTTIVTTLSTTFIVLGISFVFIPNVVCSLWVAASIVSIELGVIGLMALWGVKLNAISMVNLIMCIGFSVDFSAHVSYAYLSADGVDSDDWTKEAMYKVGLPIIFGGISTIVGVIPICFSDSIIFITFFKIVLLVIVLGMLHALIYLPTFMSLVGPRRFGRYEFASSAETLWKPHPDHNFEVDSLTMTTISTISTPSTGTIDTQNITSFEVPQDEFFLSDTSTLNESMIISLENHCNNCQQNLNQSSDEQNTNDNFCMQVSDIKKLCSCNNDEQTDNFSKTNISNMLDVTRL